MIQVVMKMCMDIIGNVSEMDEALIVVIYVKMEILGMKIFELV